MRHVAQRFGEWASASRTFSAITGLFTSLRLCLTAAAISPSRHHHQACRWCGLSPDATATSRRQYRAGTDIISHLSSVAYHNPMEVFLLRESLCLAGRSLIIAWGKRAVNMFCMRQGFHGPRSTTSPTICIVFFCFSFPKLMNMLALSAGCALSFDQKRFTNVYEYDLRVYSYVDQKEPQEVGINAGNNDTK